MALPPRSLGRRPRLLLAGLAGLGALSAVASFLGSGGHEELLSRWLQPPAGGRLRPAAAASPPPAGAFLLLPSLAACAPAAPFLLVLVASATGHAAQRQAVRQSWGAARRAGGHAVRTVFALGLPADAALQAGLEEEARRHGDILQGRFQDTYANLTLKTLALLGWAAGCPAARFVVKADDDVYLNLPALARHLAALASPRGVYLGRIHWWVRPDRDPGSRHHVPASLYPPDIFPPYCSGTAYVLSGDAVAAILAVAPSVPLVLVEDVFVGLCAQQAGIAPIHVARMAGSSHFPLDLCCYQEVLYSVHEVAPSEMVDVWRRAQGQGEACSLLQRTLGILRCRMLAWLAAT